MALAPWGEGLQRTWLQCAWHSTAAEALRFWVKSGAAQSQEKQPGTSHFALLPAQTSMKTLSNLLPTQPCPSLLLLGKVTPFLFSILQAPSE